MKYIISKQMKITAEEQEEFKAWCREQKIKNNVSAMPKFFEQRRTSGAPP